MSSRNAGHARCNYTGLSLTGFTDDTAREFDIAAASVVLSAWPTTLFPEGGGNTYDVVFNSTTTRLRENPVMGQVHSWRVIGSYSGKGSGNNGELSLQLFNPDSGFVNTEGITLPSGTTTGEFTADFITIADSASLDFGRGYRLRAVTTFTDNNLAVVLSSITRFSCASQFPAG